MKCCALSLLAFFVMGAWGTDASGAEPQGADTELNDQPQPTMCRRLTEEDLARMASDPGDELSILLLSIEFGGEKRSGFLAEGGSLILTYDNAVDPAPATTEQDGLACRPPQRLTVTLVSVKEGKAIYTMEIREDDLGENCVGSGTFANLVFSPKMVSLLGQPAGMRFRKPSAQGLPTDYAIMLVAELAASVPIVRDDSAGESLDP